MTNLIGLTVTTQSTQLGGTFQLPVTVKNTGTATVFLGGPGVTPTTGRALLASSSVDWVGDLYAVVATGTTTIDVYDTVGAQFDAGAIIAGLQAGGVTATGIADAIFTKGVTVPYNEEQLLSVESGPNPNNPATAINYSLTVDQSKYSLVEIYWYCLSPSLAQTQTAWNKLTGYWTHASGPYVDLISYPVAAAGVTYLQFPVLGDTLNLTFTTAATSQQWAMTVTVSNGPREFSQVLCPIPSGYQSSSQGDTYLFGQATNNDSFHPADYNPAPGLYQVWGFGSKAHPGIMTEFPANTGSTSQWYYLLAPNNGSGMLRLGYGYASATTTLDDIRVNPDRNYADVLLTGSYQQGLDNLWNSVNSTTVNYTDIFIPNHPVLVQIEKKASTPASKLVMYCPNAPTL